MERVGEEAGVSDERARTAGLGRGHRSVPSSESVDPREHRVGRSPPGGRRRRRHAEVKTLTSSRARTAWGGVTGARTRRRAWTPESTEASAVREGAGDGGTPPRGQTLTSSRPAWGEAGVSEGRRRGSVRGEGGAPSQEGRRGCRRWRRRRRRWRRRRLEILAA